MTGDASTYDELLELIQSTLFGADDGLDPAETAMRALRRSCTERLDDWTTLSELLNSGEPGPRCSRALEALTELRQTLLRDQAQGRRPGLSAWAGVIEAVAGELEAADLERDRQRHTRLCQSLRETVLEARSARGSDLSQPEHHKPNEDGLDPDPWSWDALTR